MIMKSVPIIQKDPIGYNDICRTRRASAYFCISPQAQGFVSGLVMYILNTGLYQLHQRIKM